MMATTDPRGWFADRDPEQRDQWQPVLQTAGACLPLPVWHATREECEEFIRREIIGKGLLP